MGWGGGGGYQEGEECGVAESSATKEYFRVLPGRGEPPTSAQAHDRLSKNPEFNGKTAVDSWEPYKQDAATPHCYESAH